MERATQERCPYACTARGFVVVRYRLPLPNVGAIGVFMDSRGLPDRRSIAGPNC